jgi:dolichol-phosphate mannosyltransferase
MSQSLLVRDPDGDASATPKLQRSSRRKVVQSPAAGLALAIVVPTYNEADNIAPLMAKLEAAMPSGGWEVIFVDDNSPDGTADVVRALSLIDPKVRCLKRVGRRGLSSACIEGVLATAAPFVAVIDADMQHDERLLPRMLDRLRIGDLDIVIGSRNVEGGGMGDFDARRVWISEMASRFGRSVIRANLTDPMSGFFMVRRSFFETVAPHLCNDGFKILFDVFASAPTAPRFVELPYEFRSREYGASKLDSRVALDYVQLVVSKLTRGLIPPRFFLFAAVGLIGLAVHLVTLGIENRLLGVSFVPAQLMATFLAMVFNYALNNATTYRDRQRTGLRFFTGLASFAAICSVGVIGNVGIANVLFKDHQNWWLAGAAGAALGAVWNYAMSSTLTWKKS